MIPKNLHDIFQILNDDSSWFGLRDVAKGLEREWEYVETMWYYMNEYMRRAFFYQADLPIVEYFNKYNVYNPNDMTAVILSEYFRNINGHPVAGTLMSYDLFWKDLLVCGPWIKTWCLADLHIIKKGVWIGTVGKMSGGSYHKPEFSRDPFSCSTIDSVEIELKYLTDEEEFALTEEKGFGIEFSIIDSLCEWTKGRLALKDPLSYRHQRDDLHFLSMSDNYILRGGKLKLDHAVVKSGFYIDRPPIDTWDQWKRRARAIDAELYDAPAMFNPDAEYPIEIMGRFVDDNE